MGRSDGPLRWTDRPGRPKYLARLLNRGWDPGSSAGLRPSWLVTLEVPECTSGRLASFPLIVAERAGERYLVSMLGEEASWVRDVRAVDGLVVLRGGHREAVHLDEVSPDERAPILRRYLDTAAGAHPDLPVDRHAPLEELERVAARFPVFRVDPSMR